MERLHMQIQGIVQGVGFRPFVHRLVTEYGLKGYIQNSSSGVELELEGERAALEAFAAALPERAPRPALIEALELRYEQGPVGYRDFEIRGSRREALRNTLISPDLALCADCRRELRDKGDRRWRYPFINCTNCGPRFTIVEDVPYDRARTSMADFPMCPDCAREYHDIDNRRYHAQPDCCPVCGPRPFFLDGEGRELPGDAIETAKAWLRAGKILAVKGLGGMHLACRCDEPEIAARLRRRKQRDEKPFALMCRDLETVGRICRVSDGEAAILSGAQRPIVLLEKRAPGWTHLSENDRLGVMLPYTPLHELLFDGELDMLVMTSANLSDTPIIAQNEEALEKLRGIADGFLLHERRIQTRCDDSLCWVHDGREYFARRSRGYVPFPIRVERGRGGILACGAEQKASFCLTKDNYIFPSQHIGDLKNLETLEHYEQQLAHFARLFDIRPELLVCDMHPDYLSSRYARERAAREGLPLLTVQHHHAHMAACMADNRLEGPCIGLIWDGAGYGEDGAIWGGECLAGDYERVERRGTIRPIPLIGGDRAVRELERLAFALLAEAGCDTGEIPRAADYAALLGAGLNCPGSSGMGRLFDGVAALLDIRRLATYEGQGAVLLEAAAARDETGSYPLILEGEPLCFDWRPMVRAIVEERQSGVAVAVIAARFINTLIELGAETAARVARDTGLRRVVLSGGSFQNMLLLRRLPEKLRQRGLEPYHHCRVSTNDEGLSLGQAMVAARRTGKETGLCV